MHRGKHQSILLQLAIQFKPHSLIFHQEKTMAVSPLRSKTLHHGRSLSLPSESHSAMSQFEENLSRVRSSQEACSSLSSMNGRVNGLNTLYDSIDELLLLPHNQQTISQECQEKWFEHILDNYVRLLDSCSAVKDLISVNKQDVRELLSAVRRKDVNGIQGYLTSRRKSKKMIHKYLKNLRSFRCEDSILSLEKEDEKVAIVYMLKDAESVTLSLLESLLSYTMGSKGQARKSGWSLISKLIQPKKVSNQGEETCLNEFEKVDSFLQLTQENDTQVEELVNHLKEMDSSIQTLEEQLDCLFRQLIKTRVFLLNILNH
ncbi:UNVERIFIED_CONTAM: hypothetical protein Scaly_1338100 [Sesamum calycinum]|uniref:Uncharacterized protein n=1 Tax=Sesamum calycinum TaxID=2727403 RepID=A0AAW2PK34_9LAMI